MNVRYFYCGGPGFKREAREQALIFINTSLERSQLLTITETEGGTVIVWYWEKP